MLFRSMKTRRNDKTHLNVIHTNSYTVLSHLRPQVPHRMLLEMIRREGTMTTTSTTAMRSSDTTKHGFNTAQTVREGRREYLRKRERRSAHNTILSRGICKLVRYRRTPWSSRTCTFRETDEGSRRLHLCPILCRQRSCASSRGLISSPR